MEFILSFMIFHFSFFYSAFLNTLLNSFFSLVVIFPASRRPFIEGA